MVSGHFGHLCRGLGQAEGHVIRFACILAAKTAPCGHEHMMAALTCTGESDGRGASSGLGSAKGNMASTQLC